MKTSTNTDLDLLNDLASRLAGECNRLRHGKCTSAACLQRGGYKAGKKPVDYKQATCEAYEQHKALTRAMAAMEGKVGK